MADLTLQWNVDGMRLEAHLATPARVAPHAAQLAAWFNHPHNMGLMGNTARFTPDEVEEHYASQLTRGGIPLLLFAEGVLAGDADLRNLSTDSAEYAVMVGDTARQGRGLGTRFTVMVHVHAFRDLGLHTVVLSIVPHNHGARRCYEKAGYRVDPSPRALAACDDDTDVPMSLDPAALRERFPHAWEQVTCR